MFIHYVVVTYRYLYTRDAQVVNGEHATGFCYVKHVFAIY